MILLEVHNRIIEELLVLQIETFLRGEKLVELKTDIVGESRSLSCETFPHAINASFL